MSLTICTGWSPAGWDRYAANFLKTFDEFWPREVDLLVWGEPATYPTELTSGRRFEFRTLDQMPLWEDFERRHRSSNRARGREPSRTWKLKERELGYSWRYDAYKWSRQAFIPWAAAQVCDTEFLVWLDADVMTHHSVTENEITSLLNPEDSIAYLGRPPKHPDIAFQLYRLGGVAEDFLMEWMDLYASDKVFEVAQWHSAWTWKWVLENSPMRFDRFAKNITPQGHDHVWHQSPLARWGDHLKGQRKDAGRSPERR